MLNTIIHTIRDCGIEIHKLLQQSAAEYLDSTNESGDAQLAVDVAADAMLERALLALDCVCGVCSEEKKDAVFKGEKGEESAKPAQDSLDTAPNTAPYLVAYDPLDGSSVIASNLSVGTIFGIYDGEFAPQKLVASGYILYGFRLELVVAQNAVQHYVYDGANWQHRGMLALNESGKINAPGATQKGWSSQHKALVDFLFAQGYRLRYSGAMVADLHQILVKGGGLFSYPATTDAPRGKLRQLFEVFPFALIYERAGGAAVDEHGERLLDLPAPKDIHASAPCFFGSKAEIAHVRSVYGK